MFTLVFERSGTTGTRDYPSLDLCLPDANQMLVDRSGFPKEVRRDGHLLMGSALLHSKLCELDAQ